MVRESLHYSYTLTTMVYKTLVIEVNQQSAFNIRIVYGNTKFAFFFFVLPGQHVPCSFSFISQALPPFLPVYSTLRTEKQH
jgi:hypothetical protein